ncbi:hypothetical protein [Flavobacterium sp.]|jgi:hypothetical protein|uniref:hypothetical protein n=1 Tax=Flavobacterium sp. TaxID=239 RepID=UPI0037C19FBC
MKIAFCLSGGPRFKQRGLFQLVDALKGFDSADFFIRTWKTEEYGQTPDEFIDYLRNNGIDARCRFPVVQVLDDTPENAPPPKPPLNIAPWAPNFLAMWWGIVESHRLFKEYCAATNETYDLVFRMRTDMVPDGDIDLTEYTDPAKMYNAKNFADNFLFGSPAMYEKFVGYWDFLDNFSAAEAFIHPEESLELYFNIAQIPYESVPVIVQPTWDKGEYQGRWRADHQ